MKKLLLIIPLILFSCKKDKPQNPEKALEEKVYESMEKYITSVMKENPEYKLDTLKLIYLDSVTQKSQLKSYSTFCYQSINRLYEEGEDDRAKTKQYISIGAKDLYEIIKPRMQKRLDSMQYYKARAKKAEEMAKTADSVKILDYSVGYLAKVINTSKNTQEQDTLHLVVDKNNFTIIPQMVYLKNIDGLLK